jgi:hypothetical protein
MSSNISNKLMVKSLFSENGLNKSIENLNFNFDIGFLKMALMDIDKYMSEQLLTNISDELYKSIETFNFVYDMAGFIINFVNIIYRTPYSLNALNSYGISIIVNYIKTKFNKLTEDGFLKQLHDIGFSAGMISVTFDHVNGTSIMICIQLISSDGPFFDKIKQNYEEIINI